MTPQTLTANATVYALKNSAQTIDLNGKTLTIGPSGSPVGLILNGGTIRNGRVSWSSGELVIYTSLAGGNVEVSLGDTSIPSTLTKFGPGKMTMTHSYRGNMLIEDGSVAFESHTTIVNGQSLVVPASVNGNVSLDTNSSLTGIGTVTQDVGGGLISPGNGVGILTAGAVEGSGIRSRVGEDAASSRFAFEFTRTGGPDFLAPDASGNDVLRLFSSVPFADALTEENSIDVYFATAAGLGVGDSFRGGFCTDLNAPFLSFIQDASFHFFLQDPLGDSQFNGINYSEYTANPVLIDTVSQTGNSGGGPTDGYIMQVEIVPEPGAGSCLLAGAGSLLAAARPRRTRGAGMREVGFRK